LGAKSSSKLGISVSSMASKQKPKKHLWQFQLLNQCKIGQLDFETIVVHETTLVCKKKTLARKD